MDFLVHSSCSQEHWLLRLTAESFHMSCLLLKATVLSKVIPTPCRQTTSITSWIGVNKLWSLDSTGILKSYTSFQTPLRISWRLLCSFSLCPILLSSSVTGIASQHSQWTFSCKSQYLTQRSWPTQYKAYCLRIIIFPNYKNFQT